MFGVLEVPPNANFWMLVLKQPGILHNQTVNGFASSLLLDGALGQNCEENLSLSSIHHHRSHKHSHLQSFIARVSMEPSRIEERVLLLYKNSLWKITTKEVRAGRLSLSLSGSYSEGRKWARTSSILEMPSDDTRILLRVVRGMCVELLAQRLEFGVKRIALCAQDFEPLGVQQLSLFTKPSDPRIMELLDDMNQRFGRGTLTVGVTPKSIRQMHGQQRRRSPRYTTRWSELPMIKILIIDGRKY